MNCNIFSNILNHVTKNKYMDDTLYSSTFFTTIINEPKLSINEKDEIIGFALYYTSYSTWKGPCIYLEDLYVEPKHRNTGMGSKLFDHVVNVAKERKVSRMDWQIIDWNEPAIDFYKRKNAVIDDEWLNGRLFFEE